MKMPITKYQGFELHCARSGDVLIFHDGAFIALSEDLDEACRECDYLIDFFGVGKEQVR